ncbi:O-antigen ligase family protein [Gracilibacillus caseinilyticus]|uniref:O-antigen ligase family protein n=1 Tax=Gracilibacillus caseinilyticus TaxID=2932256 RepID=A0ABY4ER24_9BACI|nr:O-antigen ligase family protein [Gracilibacillus caseinilyticus]UOQ46648.1 O-antigen ligase family protein [Gracilibacillus caseinilyticus]
MAWILWAFLSILMVTAPFQKGLYFDADFYPVHILIYCIMFGWIFHMIRAKQLAVWGSFAFLLIIPICYLVSLIQAVHPQGAFDMLFRWTTYISFFLLLVWCMEKRQGLKTLMPVIFYLSGIVIMLHMLFNHWRLLQNEFVIYQERFAGVFQYPNTFGMVMAAFCLFGLIMLMKQHPMWLTLFYATPLPLFFASFLASYSRGMLLVLPVIWLIGICLLTFRQQVRYALASVLTIGTGYLIFLTFDVVPVLILSVVSGMLMSQTKSIRKQRHRLLLPGISLLLIVLLVTDLSKQGFVYQHLPVNFQEKVASISSSSTAQERLLMYEDVLTASMDSPLFGRGGNAWESIYRNYQQVPYQAKKIHNEYLEMIIDIGYIGFVLITTIFIFLIMEIWRKRHQDPLHIAALLSLLVIFSHSLVDFNAAYGFVGLMVCWLFSMALSDRKVKQMFTVHRIALIVYVFLLAFTTVYSTRFMLAEKIYQQSPSQAIAYNPYQKNYWLELGAPEQVEGLVKTEPENSQVWYHAGKILVSDHQRELALSYYKKALMLDDYDTNIYRAIIFLSSELTTDTKQSVYAQEAIRTYEKMQLAYRQIEEHDHGEAHNNRDFFIPNAVNKEIEKLQ